MSDAISAFFDTWQIDSAEERQDKISNVVTADVQYDDPRTPQTLIGIRALNDYVGMFSANAPGWSASVVKTRTTAEKTLATVAFGGKGADGNEMVQLGEYFVETRGERISRMVGFAGTGTPE